MRERATYQRSQRRKGAHLANEVAAELGDADHPRAHDSAAAHLSAARAESSWLGSWSDSKVSDTWFTRDQPAAAT
jgi:hypothetical protein